MFSTILIRGDPDPIFSRESDLDSGISNIQPDPDFFYIIPDLDKGNLLTDPDLGNLVAGSGLGIYLTVSGFE